MKRFRSVGGNRALRLHKGVDVCCVARTPGNPWGAMWAMLIGFAIVLLDVTIVPVANPTIMVEFGLTDYDTLMWVTSAYLLAGAVPLLFAGRLGDRFGPKRIYLIGLAVFTAASLWCGLAASIDMLITARVGQGIGSALLLPQTMVMITRIFPPDRRGVAMSFWGATAAVATFVGPLAGGILVTTLGWRWIFLVNVPLGIVGVVLALWLVPAQEMHRHRFDVGGIVLSGAGMFLVVFALQEGQANHWNAWIWAAMAVGLGCMAAFVYWQSINPGEPLIPLQVFADRNFSVCSIGIAAMGLVSAAMLAPVVFYAQTVCNLSPLQSALVTTPNPVVSGLVAPLVGRIVDTRHPRPIVGFGFLGVAISLIWISLAMRWNTSVWWLLAPMALYGLATSFVWEPTAAIATRRLPVRLAGAAAGVYSATRHLGATLGSAGAAALIGARVPHTPFSGALAEVMLLPVVVAALGCAAAWYLIDDGPFIRA